LWRISSELVNRVASVDSSNRCDRCIHMTSDRVAFLYSRLFPELKLFPDCRQGRHALHRATRTITRWSYALAPPLCVGTVFAGKRMAGGRIEGASNLLLMLLGGLLFGCLVSYLPILWFSKRIRHSLRQQLRDAGIPVCIHCGYQLTGLPEARCPECGRVAHLLLSGGGGHDDMPSYESRDH